MTDFSLRTFLMKGFRSAVGKMADYQVRLNAAGWLEKGVLTEDDLAELEVLIEEKNNTESIEPDEVIESDNDSE